MWQLTIVLIGIAQALGVARDVSGQHSISDDPWSVETYARSCERRFALGMYALGSKVGWMTSDSRLEERDGRTVLVTRDEFYSHFVLAGQIVDSESHSESVFRLTGDGDLLSYTEVDEAEGSATTRTNARLDGNELVIVRAFEGREITRRVPPSRDTLREQWRMERWLAGKRAPGDVFESMTTDLEAEAPAPIHEPELMEFLERTPIRWAGIETAVQCIRVSTRKIPFPVEIKLLPDGTPITLSFGGLMTARLEDEAVAKQLDLPVDMLAATSVPIGLHLGDTDRIDTLTLAVVGHEGFQFPTSARQQIEVDGERVLLHLSRTDLQDETRLSAEDREAILSATKRFSADDPAIVEAAGDVLDEVSGTLRRASTLAAWVAATVKDHHARNAETAVQVLENRAGDCTEHACLFVAMARAAGIPSREVGGLVYDGDSGFAWHAWAEFHDGTRWVSVDPTWNQMPVDPTHIKLSSGDKDLGWLSLVNQIELEVDDITRRDR